MTQEKQRNSGMFFYNGPVKDINIRANPGKTIPIGAVAQNSAFTGAVLRISGGFSMAPLIRGPDFNAFFPQASGEPRVPLGMFRHSVNYMKDRPGGVNLPAPVVQKRPVVHRQPSAQKIRTICLFQNHRS
jgi:hypothetical protein